MTQLALGGAGSGWVVLPGRPMAETVDFFIEHLGFCVTRVYPADSPEFIELRGHGLQVRLDAGLTESGGVLHLPDLLMPGDTTTMVAPNGVTIRLGPLEVGEHWLPMQLGSGFVRTDSHAHWHVGRAGLRYCDLLPDRMGGGLIASRIRLEQAGPLPDYVHYHRIGFQMIFCVTGDIQVVYEDQGEPFLMRSGDCVLQPPGIRHRVLSSTGGAEVIELACPAKHETFGDPAMALPNGPARPGLNYGGQRFVRHQAADTPWQALPAAGWQAQSFGFETATDGLARAQVLEAAESAGELVLENGGVACFLWVLEGALEVALGTGRVERLTRESGALLVPEEATRPALRADGLCRLLTVQFLRNIPDQPPMIEERPR